MRKSKLLEGLETLTKKEFARFEDFLRSPYFNKSEEILNFYLYLKANISKSGEKYLDKKYIFSKLYPGQKYNEKKLINLMNHLNDQLEQFIVQREIERDVPQKLTYLLRNYIQTNLDKHYKHALKQYNTYLDVFVGDSSQLYYEKYNLNSLEFQQSARQKKREVDQNLLKVVDDLDVYYMVEKFRLSTEIINRKRIIEETYEPRLLDEILEQASFEPFNNISAIQIYKQIIYMLRYDDDPSYFENVKQLLRQHASEFSKDEARQLYAYAINHSLRSYNKGKSEYLQDAFELHNELMVRGLLLIDDGTIPQWRFKNMVTIGLKLNEYEWTENFIFTYGDFLAEEHKHNILAFCRANLNFEQKNYDASISHLHEVEPGEDVFLAMDSKSLLSKIYYEKNEWEALQNLLESFRMYVRRNKILSQYHKTTRLNFIKYLKKLQKAYVASQAELQDLKKEIETVQLISSGDWLIKMIDQKIGV